MTDPKQDLTGTEKFTIWAVSAAFDTGWQLAPLGEHTEDAMDIARQVVTNLDMAIRPMVARLETEVIAPRVLAACADAWYEGYRRADNGGSEANPYLAEPTEPQ